MKKKKTQCPNCPIRIFTLKKLMQEFMYGSKKIQKGNVLFMKYFFITFFHYKKSFCRFYILLQLATITIQLSTQVFVRKNRFYRSEHPQLSSCLSIVLLCFYTLTIQTMNKLYMYRQRHFFSRL